jgi:hypothetical protein
VEVFQSSQASFNEPVPGITGASRISGCNGINSSDALQGADRVLASFADVLLSERDYFTKVCLQEFHESDGQPVSPRDSNRPMKFASHQGKGVFVENDAKGAPFRLATPAGTQTSLPISSNCKWRGTICVFGGGTAQGGRSKDNAELPEGYDSQSLCDWALASDISFHLAIAEEHRTRRL